MLMRKITLDGFRVSYGKVRGGPFEARIYDSASTSYLWCLKWITGCATEKEILLRIGFEIAVLVLNEVDPSVQYKGVTQKIDYSEAI